MTINNEAQIALTLNRTEFFIPQLYKEAELCSGEFELRLKNQLTQRAIAKECSKWVKEKVKFI